MRQSANAVKLVVVNHQRARETMARTLVWAPDGITHQKLVRDVYAAQASFQAAHDAVRQYVGAKSPRWSEAITIADLGSIDDSLTIGEIKARALAADAGAAHWEEIVAQSERSFLSFLEERGYSAFEVQQPEGGVVNLDWGRRRQDDIGRVESSDTTFDALTR
jgi:hypothetical protein